MRSSYWQKCLPMVALSLLIAATGSLHAQDSEPVDRGGQVENPQGRLLSTDVIFRCDFESETWGQEWAAREKDPHTDTVLADEPRLFAPHRGKALRIRVDQGGHYGASLDFNFRKRTGTEPEQIYFRYYLRFADDWKPQRGGKLPLVLH